MPYFPPASGSSGGTIEVLDEGVSLGNTASLDFTGAGVTASGINPTTVNIPGGGGGAVTAATVEIDLGSALAFQGKFSIVDAAISATSKVLVWQAPGPYTGKGVLPDIAAFEIVNILGVESEAGSCTVRWQTPVTLGAIPRLLSGGNGGRANIVSNRNLDAQDIVLSQRRNLVRGNIKFSYVIFS